MERGCCRSVCWWERRTRARVLLGIDHALLGALSFGEDLLEVFVAALWWTPVGVAEGFVDLVHIEGVEEGGMGFFVRGSCYGRHCDGMISFGCWWFGEELLNTGEVDVPK